MSEARRPLPPSSSLPALRTLEGLTQAKILDALSNLYALYCPLPPCSAFRSSPVLKKAALVDSGYASGNDDSDAEDVKQAEQALAELRDDVYERALAERWLTGFIGRAEELDCFEDDDVQQRAIDKASCVLASFFSPVEEGDEDVQITRDFEFSLSTGLQGKNEIPITVQLNDGLAGRDGEDHTDVGLQSWGGAIIFSELMCASPSRFSLTHRALGSSPRIIELGAGTGLVGIVLAKMLPHLGMADATVIATDYHPTVLTNLQANIEANFSSRDPPPVKSSLLDWSAPDLSSPLDLPADMLVATDVVYEPKHAIWLRDCASQLLAPEGVFWLSATVRDNGRFAGISDTVRTAFTSRDGLRDKNGRILTILDEERLEKKCGIGRGDESEYKLFRIGWA
ncbi:putative methyltransferase-domain-containing protein [Xylariaceae sp. FL0016]|nr:putative methyltransferase-domain-containing protein [Xylariaceae sp. FL0016]